MFKNYFKSAWRSITRNKIYAAINIFGLAVGLAVCMLIILYDQHENSYDKFHANADRIFWIQGKIKMGSDSAFMPTMSFATAPLTKQASPFAESYLRLMHDYKKPVIENIQSPSLKFTEEKFLFADSNFFSFFSFKLLQGAKQQVLQNPFSIVISEKAAKKYFGNDNPVGKIIRYNNAYNFTITGVAANTPSNSSITYDFVASISSLASINKDAVESQTVQLGAFSTYFLLHDKKDAPRVEATLLKLNRSTTTKGDNDESFFVTPLTDTHLHANYGDSSNTKYLSVLPFIAALILLLALTNYISLATARSTTRAKEIGVRKVMGANRKSITIQFFIESALYTGISFIAAWLLCTFFEPVFFSFLQIDVDKTFLSNPYLIISFIGLFVVTIVLAAVYPSMLLSAYKPAKVLYGKFSKQSGGLSVRKFFTVFQFAISAVLIICGILITKQVYYIRNTDTGVNKENVVMIPFAPTIGKHYAAFKQETAALTGVQQTTTEHYPMYKGYDAFFTKAYHTNTDVSLPAFDVDENFISMLGLKWKTPPADSLFYAEKQTIIINETAVEKLNLGNNPVNKSIDLYGKPYEVIGVLKDFNYETLQNKVDALCLFIASDTASEWGHVGGCLFAKINAHVNIPKLMQQIKTIYNKYDKTQPFQYSFMDDAYNEMYTAEDRLSKILIVFTAITILIACLGLFGLATFTAVQRTKEIGIRKVLGATVSQVTVLLSKDFLKLVLVAVIIAIPVAWWLMNKWLQNFAYRTNFNWWIFLIAGISTALLALAAVSFQAIKAAVANPVKSLRTE